jgi:cell division protein FtsZ
MMGTAVARGENAVVEAARLAINSPLLENTRIAGSRGILINITGSSQLGLHEVNEACTIVREAAQCDDAQINFGVILNESMGDSVKVTVIATGLQPESSMVTEKRSSVTPVIRVQPVVMEPEPIFIPEPMPAAVIEPEPEPALIAESEPMLDMDDLDTPAYLRQGRLLN